MNRLRPRVFRLHVGWQRGNGTFCFIFGSINTTHQHIPRLTVTGRLINHVVFQIRFLRPCVEVVIVRRTAQLKGVVAGRGRLQRTHVARRFTAKRPFWLREPQVLLQQVLLQQAPLWSPSLSDSGCRRRWRFNRLAHRRFCLRWRFRFWRFCHGLWFRLTLRLNHSLLTLGVVQSASGAVWFPLPPSAAGHCCHELAQRWLVQLAAWSSPRQR